MGTSDQNKASTATFKESSHKKYHKGEPEDYISDDDDHHISPAPKAHDDDDVVGGTVETEGNPMGTENAMEDEDVQHIELPEIECDISGEKSVETSKIMKLMETVRDNVLFKNPLNRVLFLFEFLNLTLSQIDYICRIRNRYGWIK